MEREQHEHYESGTQTEQELQTFIARTEGLLSDISVADARVRSGETYTASPRGEHNEDAHDPALPSRYDAAALLLSAVAAVLRDNRDGAIPLNENPGYLRQKLNSAIGRYGLTVIEEETPASAHRDYRRQLQQARERYVETNGDTLPLGGANEPDTR